MRIVALINIEHNGESYTQGEIIENIKKDDGNRLIKLGAAKEIEGGEVDEATEEVEDKKASKKKASNDKEEDES